MTLRELLENVSWCFRMSDIQHVKLLLKHIMAYKCHVFKSCKSRFWKESSSPNYLLTSLDLIHLLRFYTGNLQYLHSKHLFSFMRHGQQEICLYLAQRQNVYVFFVGAFIPEDVEAQDTFNVTIQSVVEYLFNIKDHKSLKHSMVIIKTCLGD